MNADRADTRPPHLDLEDLIAEAAGQPASDRARAHLAGCEHCRREASRWNLVAGGVRGLAAATPAPDQPARPRPARGRVTAGPWRRAILVAGSAAAALILLAGVGEVTGVVHVHVGSNGTGAALTAVTGCSRFEQVDGTLERVNGNNLVIKAASGQAVTVATTASTFVSMSGPLRGDITDGAAVMVRGSRSGGTITADIVTVGPPFRAVNPPGFVPVRGTVADASTAGFTLVTSGGTRIPVTTSSDTLVVIPHASPGQLRPGTAIFALGQAGPGGTLAARAVAAVSQFPSGPHLGISVQNCSASSVQEALGAVIGHTPIK